MSQAGLLCRDLGTLVKRNKNQLCDYMTAEPARLAGMPGIRSLQVMNSLFNENGQCPPSVSSFLIFQTLPRVRRKNILAVCCEDNYFPNGKFKLFYSLFHSVYLVFSKLLISIADLFAVHYLWDVCNEDKCFVVTYRAADILVASLGLFTFTRIACLLQL